MFHRRFSKYTQPGSTGITNQVKNQLPRRATSWLFCVVMAATAGSYATAAPVSPNELRLQRCFAEISLANQSFTEGRADVANERLLQLTHSCGGVAHLYHNLGAIAALRRDWDQAINYLRQSLAIDRRAALTQAGLSEIYQYKAALAYREALDLSGPQPLPPAISLQNGELGNGPAANLGAAPPGKPQVAGQDIDQDTTRNTTGYFDVRSWWMARREHSPELPPWSAVNFSIDELEKNLTLVLLEFADNQQLLVLRKTGDHWQIIREKQL